MTEQKTTAPDGLPVLAPLREARRIHDADVMRLVLDGNHERQTFQYVGPALFEDRRRGCAVGARSPCGAPPARASV